MQSPRLSDWLGLAALTVMFGSVFLLIKYAVTDIPPMVIAAVRIVIGAAVLVVMTLIQKESFSQIRGYWKLIFFISITGNCIPFFAVAWGQQYIDSGMAGILMGMMPLSTIVLAHFYVSGEKLTTGKIIGFVLGFTGVIILMAPEINFDSPSHYLHLMGILAVLAAAVSYAVNSIIVHNLPKISLTLLSAGTLIVSSLIMLPLAAFEGFSWVSNVNSLQVWSLVLLGVFSTGFATVIYFRVVRHAGPSFLSQINYLVPLWAVLLGISVGGESLTLYTAVAMIVILSGIAVSQRSKVYEDSIYHD
ncbi:MAG: DMT family transporter, partial [Pseudomonadota bacterium]